MRSMESPRGAKLQPLGAEARNSAINPKTVCQMAEAGATVEDMQEYRVRL